MVELSPSAEIWCVYATNINEGTQILTFLGIDNNRDFQNSRYDPGAQGGIEYYIMYRKFARIQKYKF